MAPEHYIRIMPDYGHEYLWYNLPFRLLYGESYPKDDAEELDGTPLPKSLSRQLEAWYLEFARAQYVSPDSFALLDWAKFHARGIKLAKELKGFIGDTAAVYYEKPMEDPNVYEDERFEVMIDGTLRPLPIIGGLLDRMKEQYPWLPGKVLSDGRPGVDRTALGWAMSHRLPHGGWCPVGRQAEDGPLSLLYQLKAVSSSDKTECVRLNIRDSDATLLLLRGGMDAASLAVQRLCIEAGKPVMVVSLSGQPLHAAAQTVIDWLTQMPCSTLHIAGTRDPSHGGVLEAALDVLNHTVGVETQQERRAREREQWA